MYIFRFFLSKQVIKMRLWCKNKSECTRCIMSMDYHVRGAGCSAGMLSEIHTKADQRCRAKRLFVDYTIHDDLLQEIINKAIVSFCNRLWSCVAEAGGHFEHCLNTEWAIGSWYSSLKVWNVCTADEKQYSVIIREYLMQKFCMFNWKNELFKFKLL